MAFFVTAAQFPLNIISYDFLVRKEVVDSMSGSIWGAKILDIFHVWKSK